MKSPFHLFILFPLLFVILFSCSKKDTNEKDTPEEIIVDNSTLIVGKWKYDTLWGEFSVAGMDLQNLMNEYPIGDLKEYPHVEFTNAGNLILPAINGNLQDTMQYEIQESILLLKKEGYTLKYNLSFNEGLMTLKLNKELISSLFTKMPELAILLMSSTTKVDLTTQFSKYTLPI